MNAMLKLTQVFSISPTLLKQSVLDCNDITEPKGLSLSNEQAIHLIETRNLSLKNNGRLELTDSIISKLIIAFSDSSYIDATNYESTLHDLIEIFYYYKNESLDLYADDDLIDYLFTSFETHCQGSAELLASKGLEMLLHPEATEDEEGAYL